MKTDNNTKRISKSFIIVWAILLVVVVALMLWTTITTNYKGDHDYEIAPDIEFELPDPVPVDKHILKDDKQEVEGDSAAISNIPSTDESEFTQYAESPLSEDSKYGPIPKIGPNNETPLMQFAAQTNPNLDDKIKVAFIFTGLGRDHRTLEMILEETPAEVTMAFLPYSVNAKQAITLARTKGHEILMTTSMEPTDYPDTDPGTYTLLTGLPAEKNVDRLHWAMSQGSEYIGMTNLQGSLFMSSHKDLKPVLEEINKRGLVFVEAISTFRSEADEIAAEIKMPYLRSHFVLSETLTPKELHATLIRAEQMAEQTPCLIIVAHTSPRTIPVLIKWIQKAQEMNYAFVPVSQAIQLASQVNFETSSNASEVPS